MVEGGSRLAESSQSKLVDLVDPTEPTKPTSNGWRGWKWPTVWTRAGVDNAGPKMASRRPPVPRCVPRCGVPWWLSSFSFT